jgi:TPR repeat protein
VPAATAAPVAAEAPSAPAASAAAPPTPVPDDQAAAPAPSPEGTAPERAAPAANQTGRTDPDAAAETDSNFTSSTQSRAEAAPAAPKLATFSAADANQLFAEGQKYLYGNGVERDCGRALEDLRMAARLNPEAASLLGTMYASGHCVGQNLAPAYHWYARALHRDPANTRYKSDLEVLWNQMTPQQRQAALRIAP